MAPAIDADERRARRTRLVIIISVVVALLTVGLVWRRLTERAVDRKADSAVAELRRAWRPVDLDTLQQDYSRATTAASGSGDYENAQALFPRPADAELFIGNFVRGGAFEAAYNVSAGWGGHRCIKIRVVGPTPNHVAVQRHNGEC